MKQAKLFLLFIFCFILGFGGNVYADSMESKAEDHSEMRQEAVQESISKETEPIRVEDRDSDNEISESVQDNSNLESEKKYEESKAEESELAENSEEIKATNVETEDVEENSIKEDDTKDDSNVDFESFEENQGKSKIREELEEAIQEETEEDTEKDKFNKIDSEEVKEENLEADSEESSEDLEILEKGSLLDPQTLKAGNPAGAQTSNSIEVKSFEELKNAIDSAKDGVEKTIIITQSFEIEETLTIESGKIIVLTSNDSEKMDDPWEAIEQPKDYADEGEKKQREVIKEARERGDQAIKDAEMNITEEKGEYYYDFKDEIVLKRSKTFTGKLFEVIGNLTLGDENNSINFDGNKKKVKARGGNDGSFFNVNGGTLVLNNGVIANGETSENDYNSPIRVKENGTFIMNGGRITANKTKANGTVPYNAGAVDVSRGGHFIMNNGMIDHNISASGAVFVGNDGLNNTKILNEDKDFALFEFKGGSIVSNKSKGYNLAGGIAVLPTGKLNIIDGIVANNYAGNKAGGIMVSDQYVRSFSNTINNSYSNTVKQPYEEYIKYNKAEANFDGGLLYKNESGYAGGAVFVDSNNVNFNKTMILDNKAAKFGGGVYVGFPPRVQELENILITENETYKSGMITTNDDAWGGPLVGGGFWNCPDGYVHLGDGHSVYVFNNKGAMGGADYVFSKKAYSFELNGKDISDQFYTFISPVTKDKNIIKFLNDSRKGSDLPKNMSYTDQFVYLKAIYDEALQEEAWKNSGTFILGNKASYGAGFGSDASVKSTQDYGELEFKFKKHWDEDIKEEDYLWKDIHADIYIVPEYVYNVYTKTKDGYENKPYKVDELYVRSQYGHDNRLFKYGEVILNHDNNWEVTFGKFKNDKYKNLPAYTMEKGLPFTNEELAELGLKYLVIERETGYISEVEQVTHGGFTEIGKIIITRDKSVDRPDLDENDSGADFYFYKQNEDGTATYIGKSKRLGDNKSINSEFAHTILNDNPNIEVFYYGADRYLIEKGGESLDDMRRGFPENSEKYSIFIKEENGKIKLYLPYIWLQSEDTGKNNSGLQVAYDSTKEVEPLGYEFIINNRPYTEAKIEKKWKMLTEEEIREALGEYRKDVEVKNREIPDQVTFYVLNDGEKIVVDYYRDKKGKVYPVYKTVTVTKKNDWKGLIRELDPELLSKGFYGIEEEDLDGFKMDYEIKKVLVNEDEFKAYEEKLKKGNPIKIEFYFRKYWTHFYVDDLIDKKSSVSSTPLNHLFGDVKVNLVVDGKTKETQTLKWEELKNGRMYLNVEDVKFGQDPDNPIIIDAKWNHVNVVYFNSMNNDVGNKNLEINMYLEKDENGVYTFYIPNIMEKGHFVELFYLEKLEADEDGFYETIYDFNPEAKPLAELKPIYEYTFEVTNEEIPPEPPKPEEPPEEPPHEPPEIPDTPPTGPGKHPKEEEINPEEKPVVPIVEVEETPVVSPKKAGGAPQTGVESVGSYVLIAISSGLGLGYIRRKKH